MREIASPVSPGVKRNPTQNLGPIGSAILTFIGYKQTNKQTDRQAKFIYRYTKLCIDYIYPGDEYNLYTLYKIIFRIGVENNEKKTIYKISLFICIQ